LERELIFGFFLLGLLMVIGECGELFTVGDVGVEAVSDKGLLFLSFVSMLGKLCVEVLAGGSPVIWRGSFSLLFLGLVYIGADTAECIIAVSVVMGRFSD